MQDEFDLELAKLIRRLRKEAADLKSIGDATTDQREPFDELAGRLNDLADQVESLLLGRTRGGLH